MAVDHWRAHSTYNIDSPKIAVLMCVNCNNIHHNFDASIIAKKYKDNLKVVKNWVKKEKEIRSAGFPPNEDDLKTQLQVKEIITKHCKDLGITLSEDFWEGLFLKLFCTFCQYLSKLNWNSITYLHTSI